MRYSVSNAKCIIFALLAKCLPEWRFAHYLFDVKGWTMRWIIFLSATAVFMLSAFLYLSASGLLAAWQAQRAYDAALSAGAGREAECAKAIAAADAWASAGDPDLYREWRQKAEAPCANAEFHRSIIDGL